MQMSNVHGAISLLLLILTPTVSSGQTLQAGVPAGSRVRIDTIGAELSDITGRLVVVAHDSVQIATTHWDTIGVPLARINEIALSQGRTHHWRAGLVVGAVAGGIFGAVGAGSSNSPVIPKGALIAGGAAAGALWGGVIGAFIHTERWKRIEVAGLRVSLSPFNH